MSNGFPGCGKLIAFILIAWISHEKEEGDEICFTQLTEFDTLLLNYLVLHYFEYERARRRLFQKRVVGVLMQFLKHEIREKYKLVKLLHFCAFSLLLVSITM